MAATYAFQIGGAAKVAQPGWTLDETANGRATLTLDVLSLDASYRPVLDEEVYVAERVVILASSVANPTVITTAEAHGLVNGQTVSISDHVGSVPAVSGHYVATVTGATTFTVPVNVTTGGTSGTAARRIFGGTITTVAERGLGNLGVTPIVTNITANDFNAIAARHFVYEVLAAGNLKSQLTTLVTNYLAGDGVTLHASQVDGPAMPELPCEYVSVESVLESLSLQTGYLWSIDEWQVLRMWLPATVACPVNVVTGNGVAFDDLTVEPTRGQYANRIVLRFSAVAQHAYGFLSATDNYADSEEVVLGGTTYVFQDVLTDVAGHVLIGGDIQESHANLANAITLGAGSGVTYAASTMVNASAVAYEQTTVLMKARALTAGAAGNSIACTTTAANAAWVGEGLVPLATLARGADQSLTNVSISEDLAEQAAHGIWETVISSPETTSQALADVLSAAYLAVHLPTPDIVHYETYALGVRPGQTQTITAATRNVNNTFLITDVSSVSSDAEGLRVRRHVTAIESLLVQAASRWQDTYKAWGSGSTSAAATTGGATTIIQVKGAVYGFGGSEIEAVKAPAAAAYTAANSVLRRVNTATRGSTTGTVYVRLRASAGTVTARLRNVSDGATAGTSSTVDSTTWVTVSFAVSLTPGAKDYGIELSGSVENARLALGSGFME